MTRRLLGSEHAAGWLFVLPAVVLIGVFGIIPIGWALLLSFQHNDLLTAPTWVGAANYRELVHDPVFRDSIRRTIVWFDQYLMGKSTAPDERTTERER